MATSLGRVYLSGCNYELAYDLLSQSVSSNSSTVRLYGILHVTNNYVSWSSGSASVHTSGLQGIGTYYSKGDHTLITRDYTWTHDANGNFSIYIGASLSTTFVSGNTGGQLTLPKINRVAVTNSFTGNDVEGTFSVNYTKYINSYTYKLRISIPNVVELDKIDYPTSDTSFSLSETALTTLLGINPATSKPYIMGNSVDLGFAVETWDGGTRLSQGNEVIKKCYLYNAEPTYDVAYEDTNATTLAITNDDQQIIRNNSTLQVNFTNMDAKKGASLSSAKITIDGTTYTGTISGTTCTINVGTLNLSSSVNASVEVKDNRNLSTTISLPITILDWQLPTGIITLERQSNYYSETDINVDGNYSSLDNKNQMTIKVRTKKTTDSTYGAYTTLQDNVTSVLTLDNLYSWDVQVLVEDLIGATTYNLSLGIGLPIFFIDRLKRSVGIECFPQNNNSLEINGKIIDGWKLLWTNPNPTTAFSTLTINLNSSDYDIYMILFKNSATGTFINSSIVLKGYGTQLINSIGSTTIRRLVDYSSDTQLNVREATGDYSSTSSIIPIYVVGYKTGLF